jgi:pimeloyl-ACP methyl ester carboxylesterase
MPERTLTVDTAPGVAVALDLIGDGGGVPVVLLHGLSQQRHFWGPVVRRLNARPVAVVDQRGHGDTDLPLDSDYSVSACAADVLAVLDALGWERAVVVGHSWGGSVALSVAAQVPERVAAAVLLDGGLWSPAGLGPRDEVRARLTPPTLAIPEEDLWARIASGDLAPWWTDEIRAALAPTFVRAPDGTLSTRIGIDRHMRVLDGLMDHDVVGDIDRVDAAATPVWAVVCEAGGAPEPGADPWQDVRLAALADAERRSAFLVHRWRGALHDVPLQWPALVAGLIDTVVASQEGRA